MICKQCERCKYYVGSYYADKLCSVCFAEVFK